MDASCEIFLRQSEYTLLLAFKRGLRLRNHAQLLVTEVVGLFMKADPVDADGLLIGEPTELVKSVVGLGLRPFRHCLLFSRRLLLQSDLVVMLRLVGGTSALEVRLHLPMEV